MARLFGYERHKLAPSPSTDVAPFLTAPENNFEFDAGAFTPMHGGPPAVPPLADPGQATKSLIVEGWRFLPHSYAIVNQWQLLALSRRTDIAVTAVDLPLYGRRWQTQQGLFDPQSEQVLKAIEIARPDARADATLRIAFPMDFTPSHSDQTVVFGTSENQVIRREQMPDSQAFDNLQSAPPPMAVKALTPSRWSAEGFYKAGFKPEQVLIVPHGVDTGTFHPMPVLRSHIRGKIPVGDGDFVFLSVGAMTGNKGIDVLLQAFAEVCLKFPHARLILKGMDPLYRSKDLLLQNLQLVSARSRQRIADRITYLGNSISHRKMAMLYQAADAYVSPYRAEGFNIPVLEAAASGIPIICTRGGPTDDFVTDAFARRIDSQKVSSRHKDIEISRLEPDLEHLIALMSSAIADDSWRRHAMVAGPSHVRANYTWDRVVDGLLRKVFSQAEATAQPASRGPQAAGAR